MSLKQQLAHTVQKAGNFALFSLRADPLLERALALQGATAALQQRAIERVRCLADIEFSVFSQWGEDGILEWLVHRLPEIPQSFVEFGVEDFRESNARFLMMHRNWRGLVIDGSETNIARTRADAISWRHDLTATAAFITVDNIDALIADGGMRGEIGLLSVDIDGNDYWVWQAIQGVRPWLVAAEYNSAFGDLLPLSTPYAPDFVRGRAHASNLYYGASIAALNAQAAARGYVLLGSNGAGSNVFYVREDLAPAFEGRIEDRRPRPSRFREGRDETGRLTHARGVRRSEVIGHLPVTDVSSGRTAPLSDFGELYSAEWRRWLEG
ncbi:hypothetical protein ABXN37_17805 [Piscinibacter sakaiensis]|uniref:Uncharacterized protein n=1 Tax=Piscinibacter sakaiensis TaxID=1547922 RepID=A0A0K8P2X7_PISS1|nr:hypothetical protein [Piscinibacter sakaiensis]GAP36996.1 hypothetical protein ISF6_2851 [Piscinibacter sakaiensis]